MLLFGTLAALLRCSYRYMPFGMAALLCPAPIYFVYNMLLAAVNCCSCHNTYATHATAGQAAGNAPRPATESFHGPCLSSAQPYPCQLEQSVTGNFVQSIPSAHYAVNICFGSRMNSPSIHVETHIDQRCTSEQAHTWDAIKQNELSQDALGQ